MVVGDYLDDLKAKRYAEAYDSLCARPKRRGRPRPSSPAGSADRGADPSYEVGEVDLTSVDLAVPVDVTYADGSTARLSAYLGQNRETGEFQVCSLEE